MERRGGPTPAYSADPVAGFAAELAALESTELIPCVDPAASIMTRRGGSAVAATLREALNK